MNNVVRQVFGVSPLLPENPRHFTFLPVVAEVVDGKLELLRNAKRSFPTEGNVYVEERYWVPEGVGAVWRVQQTRTAAEGERQAEWSAVAKGQVVPFEIISIAQRSDDPDSVRDQLLEGQDLGYVPASNILVRLGDDSIIGPVRCEPLDVADGYGFRCRIDAFNEPIAMWRTASPLQPISFLDDQRVRREYTAFLSVPGPDAYIDCAPLETAVRAILKIARENESLKKDVSKRTMEALAKEVAASTQTERTASRVRRVLGAIEAKSIGDSTLELFRERLANDPTIQQELATLREETIAQAKAELLRDQQKVASSIKELTARKDGLTEQVEALQNRVADAEAELVAAVDRAAKQVQARIKEAVQDPAALLAEVAILRPFLENADRSTGTESSARIAPPVEPERRRVHVPCNSPVVVIEARETLLQVLEHNYLAVGLVGGSARRLARDVVAASLAGQLVTFGGSLCEEIARATALAFAGESTIECRVPIGLLDGSCVSDDFFHTLASSTAAHSVGVLILEGLNRSPIEAFGQDIRSYTVRQQLAVSSTDGSIVIIGTLCQGPSTLPTPQALCELGPILDTDCLTLSTKQAPLLSCGKVALDRWIEWRRLTPRDARQDIDEAIPRSVEGEPSLVWRRTLRNAAAALAALEGTGGSTVLQSLAYGWLVPRAIAAGLPAERFVGQLRDAAMTGDNGDPRLSRLLSQLGSGQEEQA